MVGKKIIHIFVKQIRNTMEKFIDENGYEVVTLINKNNQKEHKYVHMLVAEAFVENPNSFKYVMHIDGNKTNNNATNLMWVETL